jgi:peptidoglycan-N-acetylglucosamine deacetylase
MQTLAEYDDALIKDLKLPVAGNRPVNTIVQTVSQ